METARTGAGDGVLRPMALEATTRASSRDANRLVHQLLRYGLGRHGKLDSARTLAGRFGADARYVDDDARVKALIRSHTLLNFGTGFLTGLGGLVTLPIAIPTALTASWMIHTRLSGTIAALHGHNIDDEHVQSFILLTLLGDSGKQVLRNAGVTVANRIALRSVERVPSHVLAEINKRVGTRLITKAGERGVVNLTKVAPVAGGLVGGGVDALYCNAVGHRAHAFFKPAKRDVTGSAVRHDERRTRRGVSRSDVPGCVREKHRPSLP